MIARVVTVLLGLAIAGTSVSGARDVALHDVVVGLAIAAASLVAMAVRGVNWVCTALGLWMFFSGMVYPVVPHIYIGLIGGTLVFVLAGVLVGPDVLAVRACRDHEGLRQLRAAGLDPATVEGEQRVRIATERAGSGHRSHARTVDAAVEDIPRIGAKPSPGRRGAVEDGAGPAGDE